MEKFVSLSEYLHLKKETMFIVPETLLVKKRSHTFEVCNGLMHTFLSLSFPNAKIDAHRKDCTPHRYAILSLWVYKTSRTLRDILPAKTTLHTHKVCKLFLRVFETSITLRKFLASKKTLHTLHFKIHSGVCNALASYSLIV